MSIVNDMLHQVALLVGRIRWHALLHGRAAVVASPSAAVRPPGGRRER